MWKIHLILCLTAPAAGSVFSLVKDMLSQKPAVHNEPWSHKDCGLPPLPPKKIVARLAGAKYEQNSLIDDLFSTHLDEQDDEAFSMPWLVRVWFPPSQSGHKGFYNGAAALIRAPGRNGGSNIAITSADTCQRIMGFQRTGQTAMAMFGVHGSQVGGYMGQPISRCIPHVVRQGEPLYWSNEVFHPASYNVGVIKLATPVQFTNSIRPVCMPYSNEAIPEGTPGIVADWGKDSNQLRKILVKTLHYSRCGGGSPTDALCIGEYRGNTGGYSKSAIGGPFLTINPKTARFVLSGIAVSSKDDTNMGASQLPVFIPDMAKYWGWVHQTIKELSKLD